MVRAVFHGGPVNGTQRELEVRDSADPALVVEFIVNELEPRTLRDKLDLNAPVRIVKVAYLRERKPRGGKWHYRFVPPEGGA